MSPVPIAVIGVGHLGQEHARLLNDLPDARCTGIVDIDADRAREIAELYDVPCYTSYEELLDENPPQAAIISVPTEEHYTVASGCIKNGVDVLVEKPMTRDVERAEELVELAEKHDVIIQVGHVERFNPAVKHLRERVQEPKFIECDRLSPFRFRSADIDVVQDVMIHDLDILLSMISGQIESLESVGTPVITPFPDIVNARLHFSSGCVANLSASRISLDSVRKLRVFTPEAYYSLDYQEQELDVLKGSDRLEQFSLSDIEEMRTKEDRGELDTEAIFQACLDIDQVVSEDDRKEEPLKLELLDFLRSVKDGKTPRASGEDGVEALKLVERIREDI